MGARSNRSTKSEGHCPIGGNEAIQLAKSTKEAVAVAQVRVEKSMLVSLPSMYAVFARVDFDVVVAVVAVAAERICVGIAW